MRRGALLIAPAALVVAGCTPIGKLRERLGFVSNATVSARPSPTPNTGVSPFAEYLLEAFPDARFVRIDPQSPKLSLAAESVLTRDDPHLKRGAPRFSPDGRLVAYEEFDRGGGDRFLVVRKLDGVVVRRLPLTLAGIQHRNRQGSKERLGAVPMSWAPSSDAFAYAHETSLGAWELLITDLAGESRKVTGPPVLPGTIQWSPTGDRIAYVPATHTSEIWIVETSTITASRLATAPAGIQSFSWSSDAKRLVVSAGWEQRDIYTLAIDDAARPSPFRLITSWSFDDVSPSFSPDGRWVAFYSSFRPLSAPGGWALIVISADGSDAPTGAALIDHVRAPTAEVHAETPAPSWSPDSRWIAYAEPQSDEYHAIVLVEATRSNRNELSPDSITNEDVTISNDGVLAYRTRKEWGDHIVLGLSARGATRVER